MTFGATPLHFADVCGRLAEPLAPWQVHVIHGNKCWKQHANRAEATLRIGTMCSLTVRRDLIDQGALMAADQLAVRGLAKDNRVPGEG